MTKFSAHIAHARPQMLSPEYNKIATESSAPTFLQSKGSATFIRHQHVKFTLIINIGFSAVKEFGSRIATAVSEISLAV